MRRLWVGMMSAGVAVVIMASGLLWLMRRDASVIPAITPVTVLPDAPSLSKSTPVSPSANVENNPISLPAQSAERVIKKPFGILINPKTSPVQPEHFQGYHTGTDFETFPSEATIDVPVHAICDGPLLVKRTASGYGGVAVESCTLDNQVVTVIYGHLRLSSIGASIGATLKEGDILGVLGTGYSQETAGERKHLHIGIHKGEAANILGYATSKQALNQWIDPCRFVCK
jgi:murein DD-endopeptidase MepM/ murein hydrolase activator NlpD